MLPTLLSAWVLGAGDPAEIRTSEESVRALGIECRTLAVGLDAPDATGEAASRRDALPAEMVERCRARSTTPWVLILVAGERALVPDPGLLEQSLTGAGGPLAPWLAIDDSFLPDPLALPGARLLPSAGPVTSGPWAIGADVCAPAASALLVLQRRRSPWERGSPPAEWALAAANRLARERGEATSPPEECLLGACLLAWAGEMKGAVSWLRQLPSDDDLAPAQRALAGQIQMLAGMTTGRDRDAADGLERWSTARPDDSDARLWAALLSEMADEKTKPSNLPHPEELLDDRPGHLAGEGSNEPWLVRAVLGRNAALCRNLDSIIEASLALLRLWSSVPPSPEASWQLCAELVGAWRRLGRPPADLVARWPVDQLGVLTNYLDNVGSIGEPPFFLALALAATAERSPTVAMLERVDALLAYVTLSDALTWTMRAKAAGHPEWSVLRRQAANPMVLPRERVLPAALAVQYVGDKACETLLRQIAPLCDHREFGAVLSDLSQVAAAAIPIFVEAASDRPDRAEAMVGALTSLGIVGGDASSPAGGAAPTNRAERRAAQRRR